MRCKATSKQTKKRCRKQAIYGGTVCRMHGGAAPQVKKKARERLNDLVDPAIKRLKLAVEENTSSSTVAVTAAKDILDRTGHKPVDKHEDVTKESEESRELRKEFTLDELKQMLAEIREREEVIH